MLKCKNCNQELTGHFCANCGQPKKIERINNHYIMHEIKHLLHVEKGFLFTAKELFVRPGHAVREYITENRGKLIKPVPYLIFTSLIYTFVASFIHDNAFEEVSKVYGHSSYVVFLTNWIKTHYGYSNIIIGVFLAFFIKLFFKKFNYNIYEIMVLSLFIFSQITLVALMIKFINVLCFVLFDMTEIILLEQIYIVFQIIFATWAITQFFESKKTNSFIRAFLSYFIGLMIFTIALIIIGLVLDMTVKK